MPPMAAGSKPFPALEISPYWRGVHDDIVRIAGLIPEDRMNWTPKEDLWNFRGILVHVADARDGWLSDRPGGVGDGDGYPNIWTTVRTTSDLVRELERSFARLERFLRNPAQLAATYEETWQGETSTYTGHWIAFHLLEHDIHHRAELMQRMALLGIEHGIDL